MHGSRIASYYTMNPTSIKSPRHVRFLGTCSATLLVVLSALSSADGAVVRVWDGGGSDASLLNAQNWIDDIAPVTGNALQFTSVAPGGTTLALGSSLNLGSTFGAPQPPALEFISGAQAFTFTGGGQLTVATGGMRNASGQIQTFNNPFRFNTGSTHSLSGANSALAFNGVTTLSAATTTISMGAATGHSVTFGGNLDHTSANALVLNGSANASTLAINGSANTALGALTIGQNVTVNLGSSTALGSATTVTMNAVGATLANTSGTALTTTASLAFNATSQAYSFGATGHTAANNLTFSGANAINADQTRTLALIGSGVTVSSASTWNNTVAGNRALTVNGAGNTFAIGGLAIGASGETNNVTLTLAGSGNIAVTGGIANGLGTGTRSLQVNSSGTVSLVGSSSYNGTTGIGSSATLLVDGTHSGGGNYSVGGTLGGSGTITLASGSAISFVFNSGNYGGKLRADSSDPLTIAGGGSTVLNLTNAVAPVAAPSLFFNLGAPGSTVVDVQGGLNIGSGTLEFNDFTFTTGSGFGAGVYRLFDYTSVVGTLGSTLTGNIGGLAATISNDSVNSAIIVTVIPEPSAFAVFAGLGAVGVAAARRRRRA